MPRALHDTMRGRYESCLGADTARARLSRTWSTCAPIPTGGATCPMTCSATSRSLQQRSTGSQSRRLYQPQRPQKSMLPLMSHYSATGGDSGGGSTNDTATGGIQTTQHGLRREPSVGVAASPDTRQLWRSIRRKQCAARESAHGILRGDGKQRRGPTELALRRLKRVNTERCASLRARISGGYRAGGDGDATTSQEVSLE